MARWLGEPGFWLAGLMVLAAAAYALDYAQAAQSTQALTLIGAAMVGQAAGLWASLKSNVQRPKPAKCGMRSAEFSKRTTVLGVLIVLLLGAAVWQAETGQFFQFRGQG